VRETTVLEGAVLKVPRQCPLVLLVEVRLVCGICFNFKEVGAAAMGRYVVCHWEGDIEAFHYVISPRTAQKPPFLIPLLLFSTSALRPSRDGNLAVA
jgi:hypothetical protein